MDLLAALWRRCRDVVSPHPARSLQVALVAQRGADMAEYVNCPTCGGLGVVADFANRWYECEEPAFCCGGPGKFPPVAGCVAEMMYGGKRCPDCEGVGFVR